MGLFDLFKSKPKSSSDDAVSGIMVTLEIDGDQSLFVLLTKDGTINRLGDGSEDNTENDLFIGCSNPESFHQVKKFARPVIDNWIGAYGSPDHKGKPCKLLVGFQTDDGNELISHWEYGSQSQGPPPDVTKLVIGAVNATDAWWQEQKEMTDPNKTKTMSGEEREIVVGGLYATRNEDNTYGVMKVLVVDEVAVHLRAYANRFKELPLEIDPSVLTLGSISDEGGFGIGHFPLAREGFWNGEPVLLKKTSVADDELDGYRLYLEAMGGSE